MYGLWGRKKEEVKPQAKPFRRVACHEPFVNKWEGQLTITPALGHAVWAYELRTGHFKADTRASHEIVVGYRLASQKDSFWLLFRAQYTIAKNSEVFKIVEGLAFLLQDAKEPWEVRLEQRSVEFHRDFWPLAIERIYEEIKRA